MIALRAHVERAPEDTGEGEHVVDLVGVVGAAGADDCGDVLDLLRRDLRVRVGHREDDRALRHRADALDADRAGPGEADEDVGARERLVGGALEPSRVRLLGERELRRVESGAAVVERAVRGRSRRCRAHAGRQQHPRCRNAGGTRAGEDDADVLDALADHAQRVQQRGEDDDRRPVLVVVEDGNVECLAQARSISKQRGAEMSSRLMPPKTGAIAVDGRDDLVRVVRVQADRPGIDRRRTP